MEPTHPLLASTPELPRQFFCPISHGVMLHPVVAPDGLSYERRAWQDFENATIGPLRSPVTRAVLQRGRALPNVQLRSLIREHPHTADKLAEAERDENVWEPKPSRNEQIIHAATLGTGAFASVFCSTVMGVLFGWIAGEVSSTLDPARWVGASLRSHDRGIALAQRGAQLGAVYGMAVAARILREQETAHRAMERATNHFMGAQFGGAAGGLGGMWLGGLSWPLMCFTTQLCDASPFQMTRSIQPARYLGALGMIVGLLYGALMANRHTSDAAPRRTVRRVRP